jgi:oxygen-independent coproporphyrinogen-3 oxidase
MMHHVYIHVPFCRRRCTYCDFAIAVRRAVPSESFVESVRAELGIRRARERWTLQDVETLYLGGGTPSLLDPQHLARLVSAIPLAPNAEVTIEANPDDVTPGAAAAWRAAGVNRVSLGAQSFDDEVLAWMHRTHDSTAIARAFGVLREAGFDNISIDLIFGLPSELSHDFANGLDRVIALRPDHLSVYGLSVEPRTPLSRRIARGAMAPGDDDRYAGEFLEAHDVLGAAGYVHYEISSYAASPSRRSRHNSTYWNGAPYLGLGPSAHGFDGAGRRWNTRAWAAYHRRVEIGEDPLEGR